MHWKYRQLLLFCPQTSLGGLAASLFGIGQDNDGNQLFPGNIFHHLEHLPTTTSAVERVFSIYSINRHLLNNNSCLNQDDGNVEC